MTTVAEGRAGELHRELLASLAERLRPHGFRRRAGSFQREFAHIAQVVGVQKSDACTTERMKFTVNVGVWSRDIDLARHGTGKAPRGLLHCHASARIGRYSPSGQDVWWDVYDTGDLVGACAGLEPLILHGALPHLDRLTTPEALLAEWTRGGPGLRPDFDRERYAELLGSAVAARRGS